MILTIQEMALQRSDVALFAHQVKADIGSAAAIDALLGMVPVVQEMGEQRSEADIVALRVLAGQVNVVR